MRPQIVNVRLNYKRLQIRMRTLEIFAGTQSFSKAVKRLSSDNETVTVDLLSKFSPTHVADILTWDYRKYPRGYFDIVWASPPCTEYSKAKTHGVRDLEGADTLVRKALEIIDYFDPAVWILENVGTGLLVHRMEDIRPGLDMYTVDYCAYGKPYRKRTAFWCNVPLALDHCAGVGHCPGMDGSKHRGSCGNGTAKYNSVGITSVWDKDSIPDTLMDTVLEQIINPTW